VVLLSRQREKSEGGKAEDERVRLTALVQPKGNRKRFTLAQWQAAAKLEDRLKQLMQAGERQANFCFDASRTKESEVNRCPDRTLK